MGAVKNMILDLNTEEILAIAVAEMQNLDEGAKEYFNHKHGISLMEKCSHFLGRDKNALFHLCSNAYEMKGYDFEYYENPELDMYGDFLNLYNKYCKLIDKYSVLAGVEHLNFEKLLESKLEINNC